MDATPIAAAASANAATQTQIAVQTGVLRKAIDIEMASALALVEAIPTPAAPVGTAGGMVDTWA